MSRREFHFTDGGSQKFWAVEVQGKSFTVQFGRLGTTGQQQKKTFKSEAEAQKAADKLITEKTRKGYAEVGDAAGGLDLARDALRLAGADEQTRIGALDLAAELATNVSDYTAARQFGWVWCWLMRRPMAVGIISQVTHLMMWFTEMRSVDATSVKRRASSASLAA